MNKMYRPVGEQDSKRIIELLEKQVELLEGMAAALFASHQQEAKLMEKLLGMEEKPDTFDKSLSAMDRMAGMADLRGQMGSAREPAAEAE